MTIPKTQIEQSRAEQSRAEQSRILWPDLLRILAIFCVIVIHASANGLREHFQPTTFSFQACCLYNTLSRFSVPALVMISGMFLLQADVQYSYKKIFFKKILRIVSAFLFWSMFYTCIMLFESGKMISPINFLSNLLTGHYHLWFLFMIVGLYIITPILRYISKNEEITQYYLIIGIIITSICNPFANMPIIKIILNPIQRIDIQLGTGYSIYFLLGYWLSNHQFSRKKVHYILILGVLGTILSLYFNGLFSFPIMTFQELVMGNNLSINIFLMSLSIFVFFQHYVSRINFSQRLSAIIRLSAKISFGIYLVHAFVLEHLFWIGLPDYFVHPIFSIPLTSLITFVISYFIAFVIHKIPILNKYVM